MTSKKTLRAGVGAGLCIAGLALALSVPYRAHTFRVNANGCGLVMDIVEPTANAPENGMPLGYVVLLHGLSANKKIMSYLAAGFASQGLRVFVPDLPGHGRSNGPFSYDRSEQCSENLMGELVGRGLIDPERTIIAGHSLGGADALRTASHIPVAGVIAISPAPMRPTKGIPAEMLPFPDFGNLPPHSLVMSGSWEPATMRNAARDLVPIPGDGTSEYIVIPRSTHVGILFDGMAMSSAEKWAAMTLHLREPESLPTRRGVYGYLLGFAGILILVGPFLREMLQSKKDAAANIDTGKAVEKNRALTEFALLALGTAGLLSFWTPLRRLRLFEGDYFASFLLVLGVVLLALHWNALRELFRVKSNSQTQRPGLRASILAVVAACLVFVLIALWMDLTFTEMWFTSGRWIRFAPFFLAVLPYHAAEEVMLGPALPDKTFQRVLTALFLRLIAWGGILAGLFLLHSGEVLLVLLAPYFGAFCLLQAWGMKVVREVTSSVAAAALFGAILLAGFSLVVFPTA